MTLTPHPDSPPAPTPARPRPYRRLRVPPFYPVPVRARRDGWTVERQADFLGLLAECGSVIGACEQVEMSRKSAYRLRALPGAESFAAAWDAALGAPVRKVTPPSPMFFGCDRPVHLVMYRGRYRGSWRNAANGDLVWRPHPQGHTGPDSPREGSQGVIPMVTSPGPEKGLAQPCGWWSIPDKIKTGRDQP